MKNGETVERAPRSRPREGARRDANGDGGEILEALDKKELLTALKSFRRGDFSVRLPDHLAAWMGASPTPSTKSSSSTSGWPNELERLSARGRQGGPARRSAPRSAT